MDDTQALLEDCEVAAASLPQHMHALASESRKLRKARATYLSSTGERAERAAREILEAVVALGARNAQLQTQTKILAAAWLKLSPEALLSKRPVEQEGA